MKKQIIITILSLLGLLSLAACVNKEAKTKGSSENEKVLIDEGVDTKCKLSYSPYKGQHKEMFLKEGDKIALISPSARPSRQQVDACIEGLKKWGYVPVEGQHVCEDIRSFEDLMSDLTWALEDPEIRAIFCVRGGYGLSELLDELPLEMIEENPKLVIGYSDITILHSAYSKLGLPSLHTCMSASFTDLDRACLTAEEALLKGSVADYECENSKHCKKGKGQGILIGGNLSTFCSVLATDYDVTKTDRPYILFLEDIGEDLQHIHRYLTILKHYGVLDRASGIIFGEWTNLPSDLGDYMGASRGGAYESIADMIERQFLKDLDIPVAFGFPSGHGDVNYPLLMGEEVTLEVWDDKYTVNY